MGSGSACAGGDTKRSTGSSGRHDHDWTSCGYEKGLPPDIVRQIADAPLPEASGDCIAACRVNVDTGSSITYHNDGSSGRNTTTGPASSMRRAPGPTAWKLTHAAAPITGVLTRITTVGLAPNLRMAPSPMPVGKSPMGSTGRGPTSRGVARAAWPSRSCRSRCRPLRSRMQSCRARGAPAGSPTARASSDVSTWPFSSCRASTFRQCRCGWPTAAAARRRRVRR